LNGFATVWATLSATCSLIFGWLTNRLCFLLDLDITRWVSDLGHASDSLFMQAVAVVLLVLILKCFVPRRCA